jgi:hypothetical protein
MYTAIKTLLKNRATLPFRKLVTLLGDAYFMKDSLL